MSMTVDTSAFSQSCETLARLVEHPPEEVLLEEIGRVLTQAVKNTNAAEASSIKQHQQRRTHSLQPTTMYAPKRPGRRKLHGGKVLYNLSWKYPNRVWTAIQKARAEDLRRRLKARGLAKQSWVLLGDKLGVEVDAPSYVRNAVATTGKTYPENVSVQKKQESGEVSFVTENSQPTVNLIGGAEALQRAIEGRRQYFLNNVAHHVFTSMEKAAKKYPGITFHG